jgi:hypothetical protein
MSKPQLILLALVVFMLILLSVDVALRIQIILAQIPLLGYHVVDSTDVEQHAATINAASSIIERSIVSILLYAVNVLLTQ